MWRREGENISYSPNSFARSNGLRYRSLKWNSVVKAGEMVRFAYSQPYTYSDNNKFLDELENHSLVRRSIITRTALGNRVDMITISSGSA